ncbi:MAG TPA: DNA recombination protein RmuC [Thermodesulforhabdus norvegica]|uniref:DNA recombination protein RmuC n=1 Tax=Thermodesulforhabdus norvegica TaxID=39841 RepID=A0A7C1AWL8_9BACT|nr:DNA recombination protein RmuC [Thermodesulforhabdus norvegica]
MNAETIIITSLILSILNSLLLIMVLFIVLRRGPSSEEVQRLLQEELKRGRDELRESTKDLVHFNQEQNKTMISYLDRMHASSEEAHGRVRKTLDEQLGGLRKDIVEKLSEMIDRLNEGLLQARDVIQQQTNEMASKLDNLTASNRTEIDRMRDKLEKSIKELQEGNEKKLEEMRQTVDEKLQSTLERRLSESFKVVSKQLEAVHAGLGEVRTLAEGVGDLKKVLSNIKVRGIWAEVQLESILEELMAPGQYEKNVKVDPNSSEVVEFAIKLPGKSRDTSDAVWLPIDSKFPQESYLRLIEAAERGESEAVNRARTELYQVIKSLAKDIRNKYVKPPYTTDFGIMYLATEGLYAEVLRNAGLINELLQECRVVIAGPTTLAAIFSSLRMGFHTLAIEQRATEVWKILGSVKTEFRRFGEVLRKVKTHLNRATKAIDDTEKRTEKLKKALASVEQLPDDQIYCISTYEKAMEAPESSDDEDGFFGESSGGK